MLLLSWIADCETSSVKRNFGKSIWRKCMTCTISHLSGTMHVKYWCNGKRIFQNIESSSHFNNKLHVRSTNACRIHKKWQRHRALSESIRYWPLPITFLSFDVLDVFQSSSFIFLQIWMHLWFKGVKIFCQK